ncbi:PAS domain-containing sensor histidine kinase [Bradyrhizobium denitrificans]|uniref:sensor histidine kinase n=1 Tax=Bradyrhizobium denitrificans TaxID=2734912 RepID=UPI0003A728FC|nr:PAS domain-containing sensor histidine kinase [Bradyrhizobium denitrificans]MCL8486246.1 PAS domain-containing sensor histidine kinase [Bradyrhizobium denitrificans]
MDAVVQVRGRLLAASENSVAGSRDWLDPILAHQFVGRWCVELPNQPRAEHFSIEELLVKTRLIDLNGEALRLMQVSSADELAGASLVRFVATSSRPAVAELLRNGCDELAVVTPVSVCLLTKTGRPVGLRLAAGRMRGTDDRLVLLGCEGPLPEAAVEELIKSEERYRRLFQRMPIALWRVDSRGIKAILGEAREAGVSDLVAHFHRHPEILDFAMDCITIAEVNDLTVQLFGGSSSVDFIRPIRTYWTARPDTLRRVIDARFRGFTKYVEETQVCGVDGRVVNVLMSMAFPPADDADGDCLVGMLDITDRLNAEAQLRELQDEFAHATRISMLSELTASIAHELRQPLAAITTHGGASARWLAATPPAVDQALKDLDSIEKASGHASAIIQRIHRMAINEAAQWTSVDINAAIADTAIFLRHDLQVRQVDLVLNLEKGRPIVAGDEVQLQQVIHNLIRNSAQAIADGQCWPRRVTVSTECHGDYLSIEVEDTGPGIPPEHVDKLFRAFETTKPGGMGIGLTLCRSIVTSHGGSIEPDMSFRDGAKFRVILPLQATS